VVGNLTQEMLDANPGANLNWHNPSARWDDADDAETALMAAA
jgi:hypothetical protein